MADLILGPVLRHVEETCATIWVETDAPCTVEVNGHRTRTFTVEGHHYGLVVIENLAPGSSTPYEVRLDGVLRWPQPNDRFPPCRIRTPGGGPVVRMVFGSCRTAAPHEPPWTLELASDPRGRGVDAMYAHALRMIEMPEDQWPEIAVFLGDQVYADDSSPQTRARVHERRERTDSVEHDLPDDHVHGYEEYCWLYHESWGADVERWFLSVVPSVMIFDDHDFIDDWNISQGWVEKIREKPWWDEHHRAALMTYWVYQHLGNLSPATIAQEGLLAALVDAREEGTAVLRWWADNAAGRRDEGGSYRFSFSREIGPVRLVMIDTRHDRRLVPPARQMISDGEWNWIVEECSRPVEHLVIGSSLPVFVPGGLHDLQVWTEALTDGAWGRPGAWFGERVRVGLDLEDWPSFPASFDAFVELLRDVGSRRRGDDAPRSISVLSGDIHFSYVAPVVFAPEEEVASAVHQLVNSPLRNALTPRERRAMLLALSRFGRGLGRGLRRAVRRSVPSATWTLEHGPMFDNSLGQLVFDGPSARVTVEQALPNEDGSPRLVTTVDAQLT